MLFQNCKKIKNKKIIERNGPLTHWGRVTHICVGKLIIIGSDNGLSPGWRQAIIWTKAGIWLMGSLGTNFSEILIKIHTFSFKKMHLKMSSAKWRLFYLCLNVLSGVAMYLHCAAASLASSGTWDTGLGVFYALAAFLPSAHSGHSILSCPAPSICPALITTIFDRSCSYLGQPLTLVGAWT